MTHSPPSATRARRLGSVLAGALAVGVIPLASPAWALDPPPARNIGDPPATSACPVFPGTGGASTTQVPEDGFTDVPRENPHEFAIDCVAWYKVTSGKTATTYDPIGSVQRDQMATFIAQMIDYVTDRTDADGLGSAPGGNQFPCDVDTNNVHFANIQRLANKGVVKGSGNSSAGACFDPGGTVTRGQMATFIREASRVAGVPIAAVGDEDYFVDDETSAHEGSINAIAKVGLAAGAGKNTNDENIYKPDDIVRRDQMGSFITTTLDLLVDNAATDIQPPIATVAATPNPVKKGEELTVTATAVRGTVKTVTASGCGATAKTSAVDENNVVLTIPAGQASGACEVKVVTNFTDEPAEIFGGQGRSETDTVSVEVIS